MLPPSHLGLVVDQVVLFVEAHVHGPARISLVLAHWADVEKFISKVHKPG